MYDMIHTLLLDFCFSCISIMVISHLPVYFTIYTYLSQGATDDDYTPEPWLSSRKVHCSHPDFVILFINVVISGVLSVSVT